MKLIDKSAVIAEIERLQGFFVNKLDDFEKGYHHGLDMVLAFLDTLETKEVDSTDAFIEKACKWLKENAYFYVNDYTGSLNEDMLVDEFHKAMEK